MEKILRLNPAVAYREKNGIYVFYHDFSYTFFTGAAAKLINQMFVTINEKRSLKELPESFLNYLISREILEKQL
ncbi:MAG: hypothetical protein WC993_10540 [Methanoculleus sp.]|jgi:hypothetical protein